MQLDNLILSQMPLSPTHAPSPRCRYRFINLNFSWKHCIAICEVSFGEIFVSTYLQYEYMVASRQFTSAATLILFTKQFPRRRVLPAFLNERKTTFYSGAIYEIIAGSDICSIQWPLVFLFVSSSIFLCFVSLPIWLQAFSFARAYLEICLDSIQNEFTYVLHWHYQRIYWIWLIGMCNVEIR